MSHLRRIKDKSGLEQSIHQQTHTATRAQTTANYPGCPCVSQSCTQPGVRGTAGLDDSSAPAFEGRAQITAALFGQRTSEITPPPS